MTRDLFDIKFLNLDCRRCERILQLIKTRGEQFLDTNYSDIQKELYGTTVHNGHHHSMDNCIKRLESLNFITRNKKYLYNRRVADKRMVIFEINYCLVYVKIIENMLSTGYLDIWDIFDESTKFNCLETFLAENSFKCKKCENLRKFTLENISEDVGEGTIDYVKISYFCDVCGFSYSYNYYY